MEPIVLRSWEMISVGYVQSIVFKVTQSLQLLYDTGNRLL